ncbi:hypothetical protein ACH5RR_003027 [Cinchona calisaya]|uniref:Reverse transcriptase zinc-binding domain-containing protein n=1 Tax=Cinchona calisaya TaxID=153742 RepID=A0ABD3ATP5_9GENT
MHWLNWSKLSNTKDKGWLGFRKMFNEALLTKQLWRFIFHPNLLVSKVLKAKCFYNSSILTAAPPKGASWFWQSMCSVRNFLSEEIRRIGDGKSDNIWMDRWIPSSEGGRILTTKPDHCTFTSVDQLIQGKCWNRILLKNLFCDRDVANIIKILISLTRRNDRWFWPHAPSGNYSVQSGYKVLKRRQEEQAKKPVRGTESSRNNQQAEVWNFTWNAKVKHKIRHFIWRCLSRIIPTNAYFFRRTKKGSPYCNRCETAQESIEHILFFCDHAKSVWNLAPVQWDGLEEARGDFWEWWNMIRLATNEKGDKENAVITANILW